MAKDKLFCNMELQTDNQACHNCGEILPSESLDRCSKCGEQLEKDSQMIISEGLTESDEKDQTSSPLANVADIAESASPVKQNVPDDPEEAARSQEQRRQQRLEEIGWYTKEFRMEDTTTPKYYLIDRNWWRLWMAFRHSNNDNPQPPGAITNYKLARNGELNSNIRLPADKYRPYPDADADIATEELWNKLKDRYGFLGEAYSEDYLKEPDGNKFDKYKLLRMKIHKFKHSPEKFP